MKYKQFKEKMREKERIKKERIEKEREESHQRRLIEERIDENINTVKVQIWQWEHGLYKDIIKEHILEWVDIVQMGIRNLAIMDLGEEYWKINFEDLGIFDWFKTSKRQEWYNAFSDIYRCIGVFRMYIYKKTSNLRKYTLEEFIIGKQLLNSLELEIKEMIRDYKPEVKVIKEVREVVLTVREKPKSQQKSTKFICFNCDTKYDNPIKICEVCGFEFRKRD